MNDHLGEQVMGPVIMLAAKVKAALEADPSMCLVETDYGGFYVKRIELGYGSGGDTVGWLTPDEGDGQTFDLYTHKESKE